MPICLRSLLVAAVLALASMSGAQTETLLKLWQEPRDHFNQLSDDACDGDGSAYRKLMTAAIRDDNPVAKNDLAWLYDTENCMFAEDDPQQSAELRRQSADAGYPVAQENYAAHLIEGEGLNPDPALALDYYNQAISAGYGSAAIALANHLLTGEHYSKDTQAATELYQVAQQLGADQSELTKLAARLQSTDTTMQHDPENTLGREAWVYDAREAQALHDLVQEGRLQARAFLARDDETGQHYFGLLRFTSDPIIHFMGVSVGFAGDNDIELDAGNCYANRCITNYDDYNGSPASEIRFPIPFEAEEATFEALKAGRDVTFRYQTRESLKSDNFYRFKMGLKGSRDAITQVEYEQMPDYEKSGPAVQADPATTPTSISTATSKGNTFFQGDTKDGGILCPAAEIADYPDYFYSVLPDVMQQTYLEDPTKRIKPVSSDFIGAGTTVWRFLNSELILLYANGSAATLTDNSGPGLEQRYHGSWQVRPDIGFTFHVQGNPSFNLGTRHFQCKGGTIARDLANRTAADGGYDLWRTCHIAIVCDDWYENAPQQKKTDTKLMSLVEWSPDKVTASGLRWSEEALKPNR